MFTLEWLQNPELRRRVQVGLNKGEAKHALARAVFFNRLGELRDRTFENQRYRASGLNLVVAAIVLWNTVYLKRAIEGLREDGHSIHDSLLPHLSPVGWKHIDLTGDYVWHANKRVAKAPAELCCKRLPHALRRSFRQMPRVRANPACCVPASWVVAGPPETPCGIPRSGLVQHRFCSAEQNR